MFYLEEKEISKEIKKRFRRQMQNSFDVFEERMLGFYFDLNFS